MFRALRDAFRIPDLRKKLLFTMAILAIYRFGANISVPGVRLEGIEKVFEGGIFGMLDLFSGGALSNFAVFSLGIMPYITATIILQLLQIIFPKLEKIAKEGETGRRKINQIARYITIGLAIFQSVAMFFYFKGLGFIVGETWPMLFVVVITLTTGTALIMWIGELITQKGIGNGMSLIIFTNIISRFPGYIINSVNQWWPNEIYIIAIVLLIAIAVIIFIIVIQQGERKIPIQYAKQIRGRRVYGGRGTYIPIKVNQSGVIPVIFASSLLAFPATIAQFIQVSWVQKLASIIDTYAYGRWISSIIKKCWSSTSFYNKIMSKLIQLYCSYSWLYMPPKHLKCFFNYFTRFFNFFNFKGRFNLYQIYPPKLFLYSQKYFQQYPLHPLQ
ncbi:unnamed protein product [marine sediment metagenome]|uniref:Translocon Sec61/SecY plug domain-containing protein n=2 Tax=marine sediment metagenome TaxID=412755 RepID=X1A9I1_9ZZZZ